MATEQYDEDSVADLTMASGLCTTCKTASRRRVFSAMSIDFFSLSKHTRHTVGPSQFWMIRILVTFLRCTAFRCSALRSLHSL